MGWSCVFSTKEKNHWIATIPATFMTAVVTTYILIAPEGFRLPENFGYIVGVVAAIISLILFMKKIKNIDITK